MVPRQNRVASAGPFVTPVNGDADLLFDRSPVCTLALARRLDLPITSDLEDEFGRIERESVYERFVFYITWLGVLTPTSSATHQRRANSRF